MDPSVDRTANLAAVRRRIDAAVARAGRAPGSVRLIAVSKTFDAEAVREVAAAGQRDFGENRVQEALDKIPKVGVPLDWHLIGHLQSNKAKRAVTAFAWIHSIDSLDLLGKVDEAASAAGAAPRVLIQVDLAHEATKFGADESALGSIVMAALGAKAAVLSGLMIVPPIVENAGDARPWFRQLREIRDGFVKRGVPAERMAELSMGMSHDFEIAIEEGATMVRVGTAIFGARTAPPAHA